VARIGLRDEAAVLEPQPEGVLNHHGRVHRPEADVAVGLVADSCVDVIDASAHAADLRADIDEPNNGGIGDVDCQRVTVELQDLTVSQFSQITRLE
jgi:hypothetical protein